MAKQNKANAKASDVALEEFKVNALEEVALLDEQTELAKAIMADVVNGEGEDEALQMSSVLPTLQTELAKARQELKDLVASGVFTTDDVAKANARLVELGKAIEAEEYKIATAAVRFDIADSIKAILDKHGIAFGKVYLEHSVIEANGVPTGQWQVLLNDEVNIGKAVTKAKGSNGKGKRGTLYVKRDDQGMSDGLDYTANDILHKEYAKLPKELQDKIDYADANPASRTWQRYLDSAKGKGLLFEYVAKEA